MTIFNGDPNRVPVMMYSRAMLIDWYERNRARSRQIFDMITDDAYYARPIELRHPLVFYEGHLPAFSFNTLLKKALGRPSIDRRLEALFARGIDPDHAAPQSGALDAAGWPSRNEVQAFAKEVDHQIVHALLDEDIDRTGHPLLDHAEAAFSILEHEAMHQETLLYMLQRLPLAQKKKPTGYEPRTLGAPPTQEWIEIPAGCVTLGVDRATLRFGWDNEFPAASAQVGAFAIERYDVTNARFLEFVEDGGYSHARWWTAGDWQWVQQEGIAHPLFWERDAGEWRWRGMFDTLPLPPAWPVYLSLAEASAFARWNGARLLTEAEFQRAAYGSRRGEQPFPWGSDEPSDRLGVFDFASWDPQPVGSHPDGASAWGVEDLVGNGWEWTCTPFAPFLGFRPMASYPEYSADFFDDQHFVIKGASPVTARELMRPTFRNWFRPRYPYVYATFRCVTDLPGRT